MQHIPRDPYELDRLAEELVTREATHVESHKPQLSVHLDGQDISRDLPVYVPLSHTNPYLASDIFNVEEFLLSRSHMSLQDLRSELRDYLSTLKEELVKLLNDDYEAFISLSTDLKGEGTRLDGLKQPLGSLRVQIVESQNELQIIQDAIQDKLKKRATLREEKTLLHLLLKISESVTRLESLLLISSPEEGGGPQRLDNVKLPSYLSTADDDNIEDRTRGNRAKHLGRVAAEYTQLLYHVSKARAAKCVFVDEIQWRIHRIQSTLSSDLDHIFGTILLALTDSKGGKTSELEKAKWMADLTECLRTYDALGLWRDAEDILRRQIVVGFVKKESIGTIFPGALVAPHSPIVPHTPFPSQSNNPPRTPYTPYTAFASKQNPFNLTYDRSLSVSHFLDDTDDSLARLYNQLLRFVERDLSRIMDIAEKVSVKPGLRVRAEKGMGGGTMLPTAKDKEVSSNEGFEIMTNVVWAEFGQAIMDELGGIVFSAGRPNDFRKHHETTQAFIRSLEFLAPSLHSIQAMRSHPVYEAFDRRWQLPVYFQMRWKEIVTKLEDALSVTRIEPVPGKEKHAFVTSQAGAVWIGIITCWSGEVYIPELGHRFWKFTLQLLSRYKTWLDTSLPTLDLSPRAVASLGIDKAPGSPVSLNHVSTPIPPSDASSAETNAADDTLLKQCAAAIVDINTMRFHVRALWREEMSMMLPRSADDDGNDVNLEDVLRHTLSSLTSLTPPLSNQIVTILTRRCCDALLPVRSIPSQFRAMSHKRVPTEPSYFVPSILRPLKVFFGINTGDGFGAPMKDDYLDAYAADVFESVSQRYMYYLTAMKKTEESLRRLKKGKKSTFSLFGTSNPGRDEEGRDEERIKMQMILDVEAFGVDAKSLGVSVDASDAFEALKDMVHANTVDE